MSRKLFVFYELRYDDTKLATKCQLPAAVSISINMNMIHMIKFGGSRIPIKVFNNGLYYYCTIYLGSYMAI